MINQGSNQCCDQVTTKLYETSVEAFVFQIVPRRISTRNTDLVGNLHFSTPIQETLRSLEELGQHNSPKS